MIIGNVIIGQSGGPTSVINSSLAGAISTARKLGAPKVYGMLNGIKGLLERRVIDLSKQIDDEVDIELLKRTPSAFLGSCRFKLPAAEADEAVYQKLFDILKELNIRHFFYSGGNDSMDTVNKLSKYAKKHNIEINFNGIPKTIDNDLATTDHAPGYGSAAKYIGATCKEVIRDGLVYGNEQITVIEIMGRHAGWLAAAAALAKGSDCEGCDMIFLPEVPFNVEKFLNKIEQLRKTKKSIVIAVSEGIKDENGKFICELSIGPKIVDAFGHTGLGGTANVLCDLLTRRFGCKTRPIEISTMQRCAAHFASKIDVEEAFNAATAAVTASFNGISGQVAIFKRTDNPYTIALEMMDVNKIANVEKKVPLEWIIDDGINVSQELIDYMLPLIQGEVLPIIVDGLPRHIVYDPKLSPTVLK